MPQHPYCTSASMLHASHTLLGESQRTHYTNCSIFTSEWISLHSELFSEAETSVEKMSIPYSNVLQRHNNTMQNYRIKQCTSYANHILVFFYQLPLYLAGISGPWFATICSSVLHHLMHLCCMHDNTYIHEQIFNYVYIPCSL